ncbi:hypothetical protein Baya_16329 [Bagarius yarrelli]|uniref:Uncharacterized protein n=1 Tax=Bagarius yarrelli TaxID=175774 RepID=A0A556VVA0_BAGYA|nr:hypothetical protein Baya_16329 [Bagarius yarrelli]
MGRRIMGTLRRTKRLHMHLLGESWWQHQLSPWKLGGAETPSVVYAELLRRACRAQSISLAPNP